jgi:hypothetical protein
MANTAPPPPPEGRKTLTLVLLAIVLLLIIYLAYRCSKQPVGPPAVEPTPAVTEAMVTAEPTARPAATPTPTLGIAACLPPAPTPLPECKSWTVLVGPDPAVVRPDIVCVGPNNTMRWTSWDNETALRIYFPTSGFPNGISHDTMPFPDMTRVQANGKDDWVFKYPSKATTFGGKPNSLGSAGQRYCFKYDQELNGVRKDGRIIIQR